MKLFSLFFCGFFMVLSLYSQDNFPSYIQKSNPKKSAQKIVEKRYYLTYKQDALLNGELVKVVRKLDDNFCIITAKETIDQPIFKGELFTVNDNWKLSSRSITLSKKKKKKVRVVVKTLNASQFLKDLTSKSLTFRLLRDYKNFLTLEVLSEEIPKIASLYQSVYIDTQVTPKPESIPIEKIDLGVNTIHTIHKEYPAINGENITVSVNELLFDVEDIDLRNRIKLQGKEAADVSGHATLMATTIGGAGNSTYNAKGVADHSFLSSSDFSTLLPDEDTYYTNNSIFIQNHSYGTEIENYYGAEANAYDQSSIDIPELLHVFSSGNIGEATSQEGNYKGIAGYANMTGNFKMAKNVLVVGGVNQELEVNSRSSKGPAYDGRLKPELVAHGPEGTSDAAAIVSGITALLQQKYKENTHVLPPSTLLKSVLIAGADDVGAKGIDFKSGYGNVNASQSISIIEKVGYINDVISTNETKNYTISIPAATKNMRIALVWNDVPANVNDSKALVNDLDLELSKDATTWLPWVLDTSPSLNSLEKEAVQGKDHINNVELITVENPVSGNYQLKIQANSLATSSQSFSIAYFFQPKDTFNWNYPRAHNQLPTKTDTYIRWTNNFGVPVSTVEYAINNGAWTEVANSSNTTTSFLSWSTPGTNGVVQLRALVNGVYYTSEQFVVSDIITPVVDFNCDEKIQFSWEPVADATAYNVELLEDMYMYTHTTLNATSIELPKNTLKTPYIAVTPVFNGEKGVKGQTINYDLQGVNCYYKNFLAFLKNENTVDLRVNLSTLTNVQSVVFEKVLEGKTQIIQTFTAPTIKELLTEDTGISGGGNEYRARIVLNDGTEIYTDAITIEFPFDNTLTIYPNPVIASEGMFVYSRGNNLDIQIVDITGRIIYTNQLQKIKQTILIPSFKTGLLFVRLLKDGRQIAVKKILVKP
ncbi:S8 family peptidase [Tenacibaculum sp. TC6]|uniref:S8 family peptidase n=1 Tax=Tenacibaculum sp. TC6 TaxID=3423223 RepID=UPI003D36AB2F